MGLRSGRGYPHYVQSYDQTMREAPENSIYPLGHAPALKIASLCGDGMSFIYATSGLSKNRLELICGY